MILNGARRVLSGLLAAGGRTARVLAAAVGVCGLWAVALAGSAAAAGTTVAFTTQGCTTWQVPAGVSSVRIHATGAAGSAGTGGSGFPGAGGAGGLGDRVSGTLSDLAGGTQVLDVCVDQSGTSGAANGAGGGGNGGGASGISLGSDFSSPVLVAGAGGGGGGGGEVNGAAGGNAGTPVAQTGNTATNNGDDFGGGAGGNNTTMMGGGGGVNDGSSEAMSLCTGGTGGTSGSAGPGSGGAGGGSVCTAGFGGAGGAGYFGGGGGASGAGGGGGGGGSDFCATSITCTVSSGAGTQTTAGSGAGFAQVSITYRTPPAYQPDAQIKLASDTNYLGVGIFNATGAHQTRSTMTARGKTATFDLRFVNAGTQPDEIAVKGCKSSSGFTVKYLKGTTNVTTNVTAGTYKTGTLGAGASQVLKLKIAVSSTAGAGKVNTCKVTTTSVAAPTREDVVKATVKVG